MADYTGMSLHFVRMLKDLPAKYGDCNHAIVDLKERDMLRSLEHEPRLGAMIWFINDYHGDVALYLDNGQMLVYQGGRPLIVAANEDTLLRENSRGQCVGWTLGY